MEIYFDKLYRYDREKEPCYIGIPVKEGNLYALDRLSLYQDGRKLPIQAKVTSRHRDGSVRFLFVRFLADLKGNGKTVLQCELQDSGKDREVISYSPVHIEKKEDGWKIFTTVDGTTSSFSFLLKNNSDTLFEQLDALGKCYERQQFTGPELITVKEKAYRTMYGAWEIVEQGPVCVVLKNRGRNILSIPEEEGQAVEFECRLTAWAGKPWVEVSYRLINTTEDSLQIRKLQFLVAGHKKEAPAEASGVRTCVAVSNYRTAFRISEEGERVEKKIEAEDLLKEANEHFAEVFYGTFFTDYTDCQGGVCATVFQAQQNYPKAVAADSDGIEILLVPETTDGVIMQSGMSREQKFLLHFHTAQQPLSELDNRSLIYQMPDRPYVAPRVHQESGVWPDIFTDKPCMMVERRLVRKADGHGRAYGMMNFGDTCDSGYTAQGRGKGKIVWSNNEYDYPHACALMFVRTGNRRFLDYNIAASSHWMDVDVCHYHKNSNYIGGQWQHTAGHCVNGVMACSHQWVEGLLDYYHFTGDERGLETALGIGDNVMRLLDGPVFEKPGEASARETGWALRTLTALYIETTDQKWLSKCDRILHDFKVWEDTYGNWMSPYTDNTVIRVGFMISIAIGSLMRYYRQFPNEELKRMMLAAVDDLIENCYIEEWGCFYYKELPSLNRVGNNTLLLEALAIAYELTGNPEYLKYGIETFREAIREELPSGAGSKRVEQDAVLVSGSGTKNFAQSFLPLTTYYRAAAECGLIGKDFLC